MTSKDTDTTAGIVSAIEWLCQLGRPILANKMKRELLYADKRWQSQVWAFRIFYRRIQPLAALFWCADLFFFCAALIFARATALGFRLRTACPSAGTSFGSGQVMAGYPDA